MGSSLKRCDILETPIHICCCWTFWNNYGFWLTRAISWNFKIPLPVSPPPIPVHTVRLSCGDNWIALWYVAGADGAWGCICADCAPNPICIVVGVPAKVVLSHIGPISSMTIRPLQTRNPFNGFSCSSSVVDTICWFLLAANNIVNLPFLPGRQASASDDNIFWWSWNKFFPLLALTAATTVRTPIACPILEIVIAPECESSIRVSVIVVAIIPLSICGKCFLNESLWPRDQEGRELTCG